MLPIWSTEVTGNLSTSIANGTQETECPDEHSPLDYPHVKILIIAIYVIVFVLCLFGNLFTLIVIVVHRSMRTSTNFFLANLAVADILVALFCILQNMYQIIISDHAVWIFGALACRIYLFVLHLAPCLTVGILICVSVEKYIVVLHPLDSWKKFTKKPRIYMATIIWLIAFLFNLPYFFTTKIHQFTEDESSCSRNIESVFSGHWITISFVLWYFIPLVTFAYIYIKIGIALWHSVIGNAVIAVELESECDGPRHRHEVEKCLHYGSTLSRPEAAPLKRKSNGSTGSHSRKSSRHEKIEGRKKVVRLLIAIVLSFAVLTLPHHIRLIYMMYTDRPVVCVSSFYFVVQPITYLCLFLSTCINPLLYAFLSSKFRGAAYEVLCRKWRYKGASIPRRRTWTAETVEVIPPSPHPSKGAYRITYL